MNQKSTPAAAGLGDSLSITSGTIVPSWSEAKRQKLLGVLNQLFPDGDQPKLRASTFVGYILNWDELTDLDDLTVHCIFVDGTHGLCIFDYAGTASELLALLGAGNVHEVGAVDCWGIGPTPQISGVQSEVFNKAAIQVAPEGVSIEEESILVYWRYRSQLIRK